MRRQGEERKKRENYSNKTNAQPHTRKRVLRKERKKKGKKKKREKNVLQITSNSLCYTGKVNFCYQFV